MQPATNRSTVDFYCDLLDSAARLQHSVSRAREKAEKRKYIPLEERVLLVAPFLIEANKLQEKLVDLKSRTVMRLGGGEDVAVLNNLEEVCKLESYIAFQRLRIMTLARQRPGSFSPKL